MIPHAVNEKFAAQERRFSVRLEKLEERFSRKLDRLSNTLDKFLQRLTDIEEEFTFMTEDLKRVKAVILTLPFSRSPYATQPQTPLAQGGVLISSYALWPHFG